MRSIACLAKPIAKNSPHRVCRTSFSPWRVLHAGWDRAKQLQRRMFEAAGGDGLKLKFAFYGPDDATSTRRCQITENWFTDAAAMADAIDRAECNCGCYLHIRSVLKQAVTESEQQPLRAMVIVNDAFHDDQESLDEAAIAANQL